MAAVGRSSGAGSAGSVGSDDAARLGATSPRGLTGGKVRNAGLAWLHPGEMIYPTSDAAAEIELLRDDLGSDIHITLPVIVHVVGETDDATRTEEIVDAALRRLRVALDSQRLT